MPEQGSDNMIREKGAAAGMTPPEWRKARKPHLLEAIERRIKKGEPTDWLLRHINDVSVSSINEAHVHTKKDPEDLSKIGSEREGSNCGIVALDQMVGFFEKAGNLWVAITEHAKDPSRSKEQPGFVNWLNSVYSQNPDLVATLKEQNKTPMDFAIEQVRKTMNYGRERLEKSLQRISELKTRMKVFNGVEASIIGPNGELDTEMVREGKFNVVNCSIHPDSLPEEHKDVARDPKKYTDWVVAAMENNPKMNVISHIGWGCPDLDIEALDWNRIGKTALKYGIAIEANEYVFLYDCVYKGNAKTGEKAILNLTDYPENDTSWRKDFPDKIRRYNPIIFSPKIRAALKPYIDQGLKFSLTADVHQLPPKAGEWLPGKEWANPQEITFRFLRALKYVEREFNQGFREMGVKPEQVVNTLSVEDYTKFLVKQA